MFQYGSILVTGGAGFAGSNLAIWFKRQHPATRVIALDNLKRRGSETNLPRLREHGVEFLHGDIRNPEDLRLDGYGIDLILECSAEPSVLAGYGEAPDYLVNTNLLGTINCLELARRTSADLVFLSTSRVYPIRTLNDLQTEETETRFVLAANQQVPGASARGIAVNFPLEGVRSLYGATKLCSELLIQEYGAMYGVRYIINRCGVLTGPWQMGKVDQGVFALWMAMHYFQRELSYIGWGGEGKQVRDLLDIADLAELLESELARMDHLSGKTFNVGGGTAVSLSLQETTQLCQEITGNKVTIHHVSVNRPADLKLYITDNEAVTQATGWSPRRTPAQTLETIYQWIVEAESLVRHLWLG
ncbi:MAG TPA: NAD-dependent epimerase/dehydratase family protein [Ktedonobacterales bacterium]